MERPLATTMKQRVATERSHVARWRTCGGSCAKREALNRVDAATSAIAKTWVLMKGIRDHGVRLEDRTPGLDVPFGDRVGGFEGKGEKGLLLLPWSFGILDRR